MWIDGHGNIVDRNNYDANNNTYFRGRRLFVKDNKERNTKILMGTLMGANVGMTAAWYLTPINRGLIVKHFLFSPHSFNHGRWWTALSSSITHFDLLHLGLNMRSLWTCGNALGSIFGPVYVAGVYALGAAGSCLAHYFIASNPKIFILGASGATFALMSALSVTNPSLKIRSWISTLPIRTHFMITIALEILQFFINPKSTTSHAGHIGGAAAGLIAGVLLKHFKMRRTNNNN